MDAVGRLAGGLAHHFNNLLSALLGYSQIGLAKVPPELDLARYLREINKAAERASNLTSQLLAFSRLQVIVPKVTDLNALILDMDRRRYGSQRSAATGRFDLLVTDVVMPLMGGKELAQRIGETHPRTPVLYTSGYPDETVAQHGVIEEGTEFLPKPFGPHELTTKVREAPGQAVRAVLGVVGPLD